MKNYINSVKKLSQACLNSSRIFFSECKRFAEIQVRKTEEENGFCSDEAIDARAYLTIVKTEMEKLGKLIK